MTEAHFKPTYTKQQNQVFFLSDAYRFIIVPKGRRFGATQGAMFAAIEWAGVDGEPVLWGDTINGNIERYVDRYAKPALNKSGIDFKYNIQQKKMTFGHNDGFIDFRSADNPENWEGFGYKRIILNEAGIILKNTYLYTNAVLPMMMDFPDSRMYALGVPKGKTLKSKGTATVKEHPFYTLFKSAQNNYPGYVAYQYTSYDNRFLSKDDIAVLEAEIRRMNPAMVDQEIYGKFVDGANGTFWEPSMIRHVDKVPYLKTIAIGVDPSGSKDGDEVGIIGAGVAENGNVYILSDRTKGCTPLEWATICTNELHALKANVIVAERNYGGDMVKYTIKTVDKNVRVVEVNASRGKDVRAEPVVSLYEDNKVFHTRGLRALENEMLGWVPGVGKSPNRIDALVWAVTYLIGNQQEDIFVL